MNLSFTCPFATEQDHCFELAGLKNYTSHLKKCCQVALFIQDNENKFHICPYCIQVFISLQDAQIHRDSCKRIKNICLIKDDTKWFIKLGQSASQDIQQLFDLINVGQKQYQDQKVIATQPYYNTRLPYQRSQQDKIKMARSNRAQNRIVEADCVIVDELGLDKLQFKISDKESLLKPLRFQLFNGVTLSQIDIRYFQQKATVDLLLNLLSNNFNVISTNDNFLKNKVMEFVEDIEGEIEQELGETVYYQIKKDKFGHSTIWILASEESPFFKQYIIEYPWALFKISTNKVHDDVAPTSNIKLKDAKMFMNKKEKLQNLLIRDQQLTSQIQYENGLTIQAQKQIKDQVQNNSKQQAQLLMNERITKNLQQTIQKKYDEQVDIMSQKLNSYLEAKKQEQKEEVDQKVKSSEEILAKYQPLIDKYLIEEELFKDLENELKKRYQILEEDGKQLIQDQRQPRKLPSQTYKKQSLRINQEMCIECKTNKRNTLIKPCQHCLFCEQCFIKLAQKGVQCPLKNSKRCSRTNFLKKCIILKFGEIL